MTNKTKLIPKENQQENIQKIEPEGSEQISYDIEVLRLFNNGRELFLQSKFSNLKDMKLIAIELLQDKNVRDFLFDKPINQNSYFG